MSKKTYLMQTRKPYEQYFFRCKIPKDLDKTFTQKDFTVSLKCNSYKICKFISTNLHQITQSIFNEVREGYMKDITLEDVKSILRDKVRQTLKHIQLYEWDTNKWSEKELQDRITEIDKKEKKLIERLQNDFKGTTAHLAKQVDKILNDKELKPDKKNFEYRGLISRWTDLQVIRETWKRELLKGERKNDNEYLEELEEKWKIKLFGEHPIPIIESDADEPTQPYLVKPKSIEVKYNKVKSPSSPLLSLMYPKHIERMRENKRREQTIGETQVSFQEVIELLGDKPIGEYSIIDGRDFRTSLLKIPKNRTKVKRYRDKTLKEVLEMDIPQSDKMSFHNVTKLISRMSSLWNFFVDEYPEYVTENVFKSKSIRVNPQKMKDRREEFSEDDLHLIFNPKTYLPAIFNNPTGRTNTIQYPNYFTPIFAVFTGCRLEEICMMRVKDIIKVSGVWVYRIREEGEYGEEETRVKNPYSERDIPLHPELVDTLGFVRYVKHIKKLGHDRVFHELTKHNNKYQKSVSKFFNEKYLKQLGLKNERRSVSFHSFRHSVETHLTNQNINPRFIDYLQGHSSKDTGANTYMKGIKPEVLLKECVQKFDWGIDWKKLKVDWTKSIQ